MAKILITGGAGFIGSHLSDALLNEGDEVFVIDDLSTGSLKNLEHLEQNKKFHIVIDTIVNKDTVDELAKECDCIYHLAAAVGVKYIIENPLLSLQTNIHGTEIVLECANRYKKKVLIASTSEVYGKHDHSPLKEQDNSIIGPTTIWRWSYSCAKAIDEFMALAYWREKKLPVVIVRFFNTVGPRQTGRYGMVIPRFIKQALLGHDITIYGDGKQSRSFTWVGDVVRGVIDLMNNPDAVGEVFNIGDGREISINELAKKIKKMTGSSSNIVNIPYEKAYEAGFEDMRRRVPDITKITKLTGYKPTVDLDEILRRTIEYFKG